MCLEDKVEETKADKIPVLASKNLFINFWMRIYEFVIKLINIRTGVFAVATWLAMNNHVSEWVWLSVSLILLGEKWLRLGADLIEKIRK